MIRNPLLLGICVVMAAFGQTRNGRIVGQVRDERLRPIAGVRIDVSLAPAPGTKVKPFLAAMLTRADGTFQMDVPAGTFSVCAALPGSELLDSCLWDALLLPTVKAGELVQLTPITLRRGYPLTVRIEDSEAVLAKSKGPQDKRHVLVGVSLPNGMFLAAPLRTKKDTLRVHQVLVPRDTAVPLAVYAKGVSVDDEKGIALAARQGAPC